MAHTAELLAVGTELLLGNIANTDAQTLSRELSALGINVYYHTVVGDNPERLRQAVEIARGRADLIVTTGGLGPTCDDLTKTVLAQCFGKKLVYNQEAHDRLVAFSRRVGHPLTENNYLQAWLPEGCVPFQNDWGTAPGCGFQCGGTRVVMLPGPPSECGPMFRHRAAPYLRDWTEGVILNRSLRIFGLGESAVEDRLRDRMNAMRNPTLAPYAKEGEVELRITAKAGDEAAARAMIAPVEAELRRELGELVYGADVGSLEEMCAGLLREAGQTVACAEGPTGGLLCKRLTDLPESGGFFLGGAVNPCRKDALAMARQVRETFGAHWGVAVAGDETLAVCALAGEGVEQTREVRPLGPRSRARQIMGSHALDLLRRALTGAEER